MRPSLVFCTELLSAGVAKSSPPFVFWKPCLADLHFSSFIPPLPSFLTDFAYVPILNVVFYCTPFMMYLFRLYSSYILYLSYIVPFICLVPLSILRGEVARGGAWDRARIRLNATHDQALSLQGTYAPFYFAGRP